MRPIIDTFSTSLHEPCSTDRINLGQTVRFVRINGLLRLITAESPCVTLPLLCRSFVAIALRRADPAALTAKTTGCHPATGPKARVPQDPAPPPMEQPDLLTPAQILDATAAFFGQPVLKLTAPGGKSRTSFRAYLPGRTVIVSQRKQSAKSAVETHVLTALEGSTDRLPRLLGRSGGLTFQSDVGQRRLNWVIHTLVPDQRPALAAQAVDALFEIHRAADRVDLAATLPRPAVPRSPDDKIFAAADRLAVQLRTTPAQNWTAAPFARGSGPSQTAS
jgi:hypothetical protein